MSGSVCGAYQKTLNKVGVETVQLVYLGGCQLNLYFRHSLCQHSKCFHNKKLCFPVEVSNHQKLSSIKETIFIAVKL